MTALGELRRGATKRGAKRGGKRENRAAFLFLLPWFVGLVCITAGPIAASFVLEYLVRGIATTGGK